MLSKNGKAWKLNWAHGRAEVQETGAMLGPVWFRLEDGREFQPMYVAPWKDEVQELGLTGMLAHLRGEWPCVPFGGDATLQRLPAGWAARTADVDSFYHGYSSHHPWELREEREGYLHLAIEYPEESPILALDRWIRALPDRPAVNVTLGIRCRSSVELPVALHLTFRMPATVGSLHLSAADDTQVVTYPFQLEPGISKLLPDHRSRSLSAIESVEGPLDLSHLPWPFATEEVAQMVDCRGPISLDYLQEDARVLIDWDQQLLPDVVLWISNGGRAYKPWNGRNFALGVEPVAGPFDLGRVAVPPAAHPLAGRLLKILPGEQTLLNYRLTASCLK